MITRRTFVKAGGCALVAYAGAPRFLLRAAHAADASGKVLVAIFQRGAVDGLSMVTPYGDPGYTGVRPSIGLQPPRRGESERAADLDAFFAFHPSLAPLVRDIVPDRDRELSKNGGQLARAWKQTQTPRRVEKSNVLVTASARVFRS